MSTSFRTLVRGFLFVGGVAYAISGALSGSTLRVGFGLFAADEQEPTDQCSERCRHRRCLLRVPRRAW